MGHHVLKLFTENVTFNVAHFLEESDAEKAANATRKMFYETLTHYEVKGKRSPFEKYMKTKIWCRRCLWLRHGGIRIRLGT